MIHGSVGKVFFNTSDVELEEGSVVVVVVVVVVVGSGSTLQITLACTEEQSTFSK